jgi:hypothetical protein
MVRLAQFIPMASGRIYCLWPVVTFLMGVSQWHIIQQVEAGSSERNRGTRPCIYVTSRAVEPCKHYHEDYGFETRVVCFHNVYGPLGTSEEGKEKAPAAISRKVALAADGDEI